ncbi:M48 family metallopeptidase [Fortiea contorta]|uniref:M48 family metallopeptidase n=1 Tax=Fortiea contorta TaxID=1892405 RepID=UPI000372FE67|nr:M48 family metallopeptidase [Fortiea contorta]
MTKKVLVGLKIASYQHPFDQKALTSLNKMPGLPLLMKKVNEYGVDRLLRMQVVGGEFKVTPRNFPKLHDAFLETCKILDFAPEPELYLFRGMGNIQTYAVGAQKPIVGVNLEAMEWYTPDELLFALGHEVARIKGGYILYQQIANVMPLLKNIISSTTLGLGGLATSGIEMALYNWIIMSRFTSDRAGLLACQDVNVAITALMKLAGLPGDYLNTDTIADFQAQAREFTNLNLDSLDQITKIFSFMEYQFPWAVMRAAELLKWVDSGEYEQLIQAENLPQPENTTDWNFMSSW